MKPRSTNRKLNFDKKTIVRLDADAQSRINGGIELTVEALPTLRSAIFCLTITCCYVDDNVKAIIEPDRQGNDMVLALPAGLPAQL